MTDVPHVHGGLNRRGFLNRTGAALALGLGGLLVTSCQEKTATGPEEIEDTDVCAGCGMMISDLRYVGEIFTPDHVWKFDDLGEMFVFPSQKKLGAKDLEHLYVHDFRSKAWMKAKSATYVVARSNRTPMGSGIAAFKEADAARQYAQSVKGTVHSYQQLLADPPSLSPNA